jgi:trk system potassium uptake protein TrkA
MRIILVGGGKVGSHLARELKEAGHVVTVIEQTERRSQELSDESRVLVFEGDGTDVSVLKAADVDRTDWTLGVTGLDEVNLVACQLALTLGSKRVLARLNNPRNRPTFDALNIPVVAVTDLMAEVISREVAVPDLDRLAVIGKGDLSICEIEVSDGFSAAKVADLDLPRPTVLVAVLRDEHAWLPEGETEIRPGDRVTAVTTLDNEQKLHEVFMVGAVPDVE